MREILNLILAWAAGGVLGAMFFGSLWWTVQKGLSSKQPALWLFFSLFLRMSLALTGFYFVSGGHWERLLACLLGFIVVRFLVARLTGPAAEPRNLPSKDAGYAP